MSLQNLFVAKLPRNLTDSDLHQIFAAYEPTSAKIMLDAATGRSKGFGFVLFETEEKGEKAYKALNRKNTRSCGHNFTLAIYPSNHDGRIATEASNSLYIRNIPLTASKEKVENFLKTFGNLTYCAMREDHYGSPVWVVYAEYERVEDAKNALAKLHGNNTYFHGSAPILAKFEDTDDAKRERRKRREGTGASHSVPSSGCIFPPPRPHPLGSKENSSQPDHANHSSNSNPNNLSPAATGALPAGMTTSSSLGGAGSAMDSWTDMAHTAPTPDSNNFLFAKRAPPPPQLDPSHGPGHHLLQSTSSANMIPDLHAAAALRAQLLQDGGGGSAYNGLTGSLPGNGTHGTSLQGASRASHHHHSSPDTTGALQNAFAAALMAPPPSQAFSLPVNPQLLHPTPGYCYTLSGSGQQIFIPATTLSSPVELGATTGGAATSNGMTPSNSHFLGSHHRGSGLASGAPFATHSPTGPQGRQGAPGGGVSTTMLHAAVQSAPPFFATGSPLQGQGSQNQGGTPGHNGTAGGLFPLLNPQPSSPVVLVDGGHQFVLSGDAVNLNQRAISSNGAGSPIAHSSAHSFPVNNAADKPTQFQQSPPHSSFPSTSGGAGTGLVTGSGSGGELSGGSGIPFLTSPQTHARNQDVSSPPGFPALMQLGQQVSPQQAPKLSSTHAGSIGENSSASASPPPTSFLANAGGSGSNYLFLRSGAGFDA